MQPGPRRRSVLVTGASSGIGRAAALAFGTLGDSVTLVARREHRLQEVAEQIERAGGHALVFSADLAARNSAEDAVDAAVKEWGRLDVIVNNAGYGVYGSIEECFPEDFERQMRVNYLAVVYGTKRALPHMRAQGSGSIINVCSISGMLASPLDATYCASKFAVTAFTDVLRMELAHSNIHVSMISPGYTKTEWAEAVVQRRPFSWRTRMRPLPAERVAQLIVSCADRPQRNIIVPGALQFPLWLQRLSPRLHDWRQLRFRR